MSKEREGWMVGDELHLTEREAQACRDARFRLNGESDHPIRKVRVIVRQSAVETEQVPYTVETDTVPYTMPPADAPIPEPEPVEPQKWCQNDTVSETEGDSYVIPFINSLPDHAPTSWLDMPFPSSGFSLPRWGANQLAIILNGELLRGDPKNLWHVVVRHRNGFRVVKVVLPFNYAPGSACATPIPDGMKPVTNCEARRQQRAWNERAMTTPGRSWALHVKPIASDIDGDLYPVRPDAHHFAASLGPFEDVTFSVHNCNDGEEAMEKLRATLAGVAR